jgi:3-oxoacyl-[acyl-carrier protein] reductase
VADASTRPSRVLVSGGSRGLGLAFCRRHLALGRSVATFARTVSPALEALAADVGGRLAVCALDLADGGAPRLAVEWALSEMGAIDVLVNNVAVAQDALLAHTADDEIERIVRLNVVRSLQLTRHAVRAMMVRGGGTILNVSSICATRGFPGVTAYAASKGALEAFTRSAARELGPHGIAVNCIAPGYFESELSALLSAGGMDAIRRRTPTGALTTVEQLVEASEPLVAGRALNITGQVLTVDGGATV